MLNWLSVGRLVLLLLVVLSLGVSTGDAATDAGWAPRNDASKIQTVVDELLAELSIPDQVSVVLVPQNPLLVSVEASSDDDVFRLSLEDGFLDALTQEELRAVVAHELGHVWIFTHHPYLQTEKLANEVAMRVVSRDTLQRVYGKVWERTGAKGDMLRFLGH